MNERIWAAPDWGRRRLTLRRRLALNGLVSGIPRICNRQLIFSGIVEVAYVSATLAYAFANRSVWHGNYPIVGTMRVYVLRKLGMILWRWDDAPIHPVLGRLEGYV